MVVLNGKIETKYPSKYQIYYQKNKETRKAKMRLYYYLNKDKLNDARKRKRKLTKGQKEFREKRAKCVWYLKRVKGYSYRQIADRLSIYDAKNVWRILKRYERNINEKA